MLRRLRVDRDTSGRRVHHSNLAEYGTTDLEPLEEMHAALKHYAETDVQPLFERPDARPFSA